MMTPPNFALCLTCLFSVNLAPVATLNQSFLHLKSADVGDSVTLQCKCHDKVAIMFFWYKQTLAQKPKLVFSYYKHGDNGTFNDEFEDNPRFSLDNKNSKNDLKISDLRISDSANYFCVSSNLYDFDFVEGTTVIVKGSDLIIQALVRQSSSESVPPGDSVTLNCTVHTGTCDGEHSVYWFKKSEDPQPGIIYTHGGKNDQCEKKPDTQTHTCVYNLPVQSASRTNAWTYYCAAASCGHVLFGNETKLDSGDMKDSVVLVYLLSGALAFTTILVVVLAFSVYKLNKRTRQYTAASTVNTEDAENLHYAALKYEKANRARRQTDDTLTECVYSGVRQ